MSSENEMSGEKTPVVKKQRVYKNKRLDGEVVLVEEAKLPPPVVISEEKLEKELKPKKPLSEKQKANLQRLIDLNRTRREEKNPEKLSKEAQAKLNDPKTFQVPDEVEEGMVPVVIKAKRTPKKVGAWEQPESKSGGLQQDTELHHKLDALQSQFKDFVESKSAKEPKEKERPKFTRRVQKKVKLPDTDTEQTETETDTDVETLNKKLTKKVETIRKIDSLFDQHKYSNLSVF